MPRFDIGEVLATDPVQRPGARRTERTRLRSLLRSRRLEIGADLSRANRTLTSICLGMADDFPALRFTWIVWLPPSRNSSHPLASRCRISSRRFMPQAATVAHESHPCRARILRPTPGLLPARAAPPREDLSALRPKLNPGYWRREVLQQTRRIPPGPSGKLPLASSRPHACILPACPLSGFRVRARAATTRGSGRPDAFAAALRRPAPAPRPSRSSGPLRAIRFRIPDAPVRRGSAPGVRGDLGRL